MDVGGITEKGLEPIRELLGELEGVFPSKFGGNGNWNGSGSDWTDAYMFVHRLGASGPLRVGVGTEVDDPGKKMVTVSSRASVGLGTGDLYKSESNMTEYTGILVDVLGKLYPRNSTLGATRKLAEDLVQFEKKLVQIGPAMGSRVGLLHCNIFGSTNSRQNASKSVSLSEVSKLIPQINIEKIVRRLAPPDYSLKGVILDPTSLSNMSRILTSTAPETIKAYFIWRTIAAVQDKVIAPGVFDRWNKLRTNLNLANPPPADRAKYCMTYINNGLGWLVSRFFIEGFFSAHDKQLSDQIIADLRHVYAEKFRTMAWMDDGTKKKATEKVEKMNQKVGYPTDVSSLFPFPY
jgi:endothelin-converting enzyme